MIEMVGTLPVSTEFLILRNVIKGMRGKIANMSPYITFMNLPCDLSAFWFFSNLSRTLDWFTPAIWS